MKKTNDCSDLVRDLLFKNLSDIPFGECDDYRKVRHYLLRYNYLRKFNDNKSSETKSERTYEKWCSSEVACFTSNQRIGNAAPFSLVGELCDSVRNHIVSVIGETPPTRLFERSCRFSPGASYNTKRGIHYSNKMKVLAVTHAASYYLDAFKGISDFLEVVPGNRMCAVPKTTEIDRLIACEPSGNAFLQQAVGGFFKQRLLDKADIDLFDQTRNQRGAFEALVDGYATIDLEAASDSLSTELVRAVLPHEWFSLLDSLRSHKTLYNGKWRYLDKFSSMGNGFTFELETLIFWATCKSVCQDSQLLVYGDDIIVSQRDANNCINALHLIGFKVNVEKSFLSGRYYESCGKHYYDLEDVTPVYQKEPIVCVRSAMRAHNRLIRWALRGDIDSDYKIVRAACQFLRNKFVSAYDARGKLVVFNDCVIPYGVERDDGWLVPGEFIKKDANGDFRTKVLKIHRRTSLKLIEDNCYLYKLYKPLHTNEDPEGYALVDEGDLSHVSVRKTVIWASSLNN